QSAEEEVAKANHLKTWAWESTPLMVGGGLYISTSLVTRLVDHSCTDYDGVCAGAEDSLRLPNEIRNDATGRDFPWPYRSSCGGLTRKAENFWNSAPCSTKAPAGYCLQFANLCGAGRGYP